MARQVLADAYQPGDVICVDVSDDALTFQTERTVNADVPIAA